MLHKLLSQIGFDSVRIDTVVQGEAITRGQLLSGEIRLNGGQRNYRINHISLELESDASTFNQEHKLSQHPVLIHHQNLAEDVELPAGEEMAIGFEFLIPYSCPITWGQQAVKLHTRLALPRAIDPKDLDPLQIQPETTTRTLLNLFYELGWRDAEPTGFCTEIDQSGHKKLVQAFAFEHPRPEQLAADLGTQLDRLNMLVLANAIGIEIQFNTPNELTKHIQWIDQAPHEATTGAAMAWHLSHKNPVTREDILNILRSFVQAQPK